MAAMGHLVRVEGVWGGAGLRVGRQYLGERWRSWNRGGAGKRDWNGLGVVGMGRLKGQA